MNLLGIRSTVLFMAIFANQAVAAADDIDCGRLQNHFGPFDYRTADQKTRDLVESFHFTPDVESLRQGNTNMNVMGDINYTLRVFPNHPRALFSMATLAQRQKTDKPAGSQYTVDCWFERAMRFQPEDGQVRLVYGIALLRANKRKEGIQQLEAALTLLGDNANANYNLGLAYFDEKDYQKSLAYAKKAYAAGFSLPGLRRKLEQAGKWSD